MRALTGGRGADFVFVTVGRASAIESGLGLVRRGGTLVVVGMPPSGETFRVVAVDLAHDDVRILGSKMGSARLEVAVPRLVELYEAGPSEARRADQRPLPARADQRRDRRRARRVTRCGTSSIFE